MLRNAAFLADPQPPRKRSKHADKRYWDWAHPAKGNLFCIISGSAIYERHHLRADERGPMGTGYHDDRLILPLHPDFHRGVHGELGEKPFLAQYGIHDPVGTAREIYRAYQSGDRQAVVAALVNAMVR